MNSEREEATSKNGIWNFKPLLKSELIECWKSTSLRIILFKIEQMFSLNFSQSSYKLLLKLKVKVNNPTDANLDHITQQDQNSDEILKFI